MQNNCDNPLNNYKKTFIEDIDLSSKIEKTAVQMEYRNYNSGGLKSK